MLAWVLCPWKVSQGIRHAFLLGPGEMMDDALTWWLVLMQLHFWLEATAYFKIPKGQEQELIGTQSCSLEKVECSNENLTRKYI